MEKTLSRSPNLMEMGAVIATGVLHLVLIPLGGFDQIPIIKIDNPNFF